MVAQMDRASDSESGGREFESRPDRQPMTRAELRRIATEYGKQRLADALGWTVRTLDRKIAGQHAISKADTLAVQHVVGCIES